MQTTYHYSDTTAPAVVNAAGYAVLTANTDKTQGGIDKETAERALRHACAWLNEQAAPPRERFMHYRIRPYSGGRFECVASRGDIADPANWRARIICDTIERAGLIMHEWQAFYECFEPQEA